MDDEDREEFMASLEGLDEDEKRARMMEFIENIRTVIAARKAAMQEEISDRKEVYQEHKEEMITNRDEFRSSLDGLSREERIKAILDRVAEIKKQMEEQMDDDHDHDDGEHEHEDEHEDDDDHEDELDEDDESEDEDSDDDDSESDDDDDESDV